MARPLDEVLEMAAANDIERPQERHLVRSTGRAFAAAISSLIIATLVVNTSAETLRQTGTVTGNSFESGTVTLVDDDGGRSLVQLDDMAPNRPIERCIKVDYEGNILPVDLFLTANSTGPLAQHIILEVEKGSGAGFDSCQGFEPSAPLFQGTLSELVELEATSIGTILNENETVSFRFRFEVADEQEAVGLSSTADFVWEAVPS